MLTKSRNTFFPIVVPNLFSKHNPLSLLFPPLQDPNSLPSEHAPQEVVEISMAARGGVEKAFELIRKLPRVALDNLKPLPGTRRKV